MVDLKTSAQEQIEYMLTEDDDAPLLTADEDIKSKISQSQQEKTLEIKVKVIEITSKVLEAVGYGNVILPTVKRLQIVRSWLPFVRNLKPSVDSLATDEDDCSIIKFEW
ncbi:hypothetical protein R6Q59_030790 [Mikania micrantha]